MWTASFARLIRVAVGISVTGLFWSDAVEGFPAYYGENRSAGVMSSGRHESKQGFGVAGVLGQIFNRATGRAAIPNSSSPTHQTSGSWSLRPVQNDRFGSGPRRSEGSPARSLGAPGGCTSLRSTTSATVIRITESTSIIRTADEQRNRELEKSRRAEVGYWRAPIGYDDSHLNCSQTSARMRDTARLLEMDRLRDLGRCRPTWYVPPARRDGFYHYPTRPYSRPLRYGYWVFGGYDPTFCRKSVYFYYGCLPCIEIMRVYIGPYVTVSYGAKPVVVREVYYLVRSAASDLDRALSDIRNAWLNGRSDLIARHVRGGRRVAVFLDGRYDYSVKTDDYVEMTTDALSEIQTVSFTWQTVKQRVDGAYTAFGRHIYRDSDGTTKSIYVSYTLRRIGDEYFIEEVGSSLSRLD
ncbi:MAG: hypothetical protein ACP5R5_08320 [Armatimonadota bacterium]